MQTCLSLNPGILIQLLFNQRANKSAIKHNLFSECQIEKHGCKQAGRANVRMVTIRLIT